MSGFRLQRPDGSIAIDANYLNLALRASGVIATRVGRGSTPNFRVAELVVPSDQAIIAFRADQPTGITYAEAGNGQVKYSFSGVASGSFDYNIQWWSFDLAKYAQQFEAPGKMIVRRPRDGEIVFHSKNKYLKVQDFWTPDNQNNAPTTDGHVFRDYSAYPAAIQVNSTWAWVRQLLTAPGFIIEQKFASMIWASGNRISTGPKNTYYNIDRWDGQPGTPTWAYGGGVNQIMVIDLSLF